MRRLRPAACGLVLLVLAGCAGMHPGAAAVVDGERITLGQVDEAAGAYCRLTLLQAGQQGTNSLDNAEVRRQAVADQVALVVAERLAERRGVRVPAKTYALTSDERAELARTFPGADVDALARTVQDSRRLYRTEVELAARAAGTPVTPQDEPRLYEQGQALVADAVGAADVEVDPRFGLADDLQDAGSVGSLSVTAASDARPDPAALPAVRQCS